MCAIGLQLKPEPFGGNFEKMQYEEKMNALLSSGAGGWKEIKQTMVSDAKPLRNAVCCGQASG
jgi:hypothetical protein